MGPGPSTEDDPSRPGSYAVVLASAPSGRIHIGRLGALTLDGGPLVHVGSALGPGGVDARCRRHQRIAARPHWHLDDLRPHGDLLAFWVADGDARLEHRWALALGKCPGACWPLAGFGTSDCRCPAHLVRLPELPTAQSLAEILGAGCWLEPIVPAPAPKPTA